MTTISRRGFTLGLGAATLAGRILPRVSGHASQTKPAGLVLAASRDPLTGEFASPLSVIDLSGGAAAVEIAVPVVARVTPMPGTSRAVAVTDTDAYLMDAATAETTWIRPGNEETVAGDLVDLNAGERPETPPDRFTLFSDGDAPRWLVDLEEVTVVDLASTIDPNGGLIQFASIVSDGERLLLGKRELLQLVDVSSLQVEHRISEGAPFSDAHLSPGGDLVGYVTHDVTDARPRPATLWLASIGDDTVAEAFRDQTGTLGFFWIDDGTVVFSVRTDDGVRELSRLAVDTGETTALGRVPAWSRGTFVLAGEPVRGWGETIMASSRGISST